MAKRTGSRKAFKQSIRDYVETRRSFAQAAKRINKAARELEREVGRGASRMIGEEIMADVKASRAGHGVPVRDNVLRPSGRVEQRPGPGQLVELTFGGASAPYALVQHENMRYHHTVGEARYLVRGVERWRPTGSGAMRQLQRKSVTALRKGRKP